MEAESRSRTELALPTPQEPASASEIELAEISLQESVLLERPVPTAPRQTWLTVLKRELEFLGVSEPPPTSTGVKTGSRKEYFAISGISSIMSEKKPSAYLIRGCLGANAVSGVAAGTGVGILISNLKQSATYIYSCEEVFVNDYCSLACFSTEVVAMILFLTILGFGSAVSLIAYGIGEILEGNQIPEDRLYEEVNIYAPIYSELEEREEPTSPADS
ncbi:high affinity immunoglobulin epsilon receptor subunit beta [Bos indicus x Bos taurus]|uniref:high affinity immunoglobulin epsilon receptor subunit beta n=1 Tax=Bos indicus x Bos taurus TaxID=30522 RepID=UPI000F7D2A96|nr:high affinity immunoglobulin epsilon receptor subunit beta [Bos indicus x Bos taurus]